MTQDNLCDYIVENKQRIMDAISVGAGWEIWMQVELVLILRHKNCSAAREAPYPNCGMILDFLIRDQDGAYAVEMKVESATNSGALIAYISGDIEKIKNFSPDYPCSRWVVGIGYSIQAKGAMGTFAQNPLNNAVYKDAGVNDIAVIVINVQSPTFSPLLTNIVSSPSVDNPFVIHS
jgi:hypothetical protein